MVIRTGYLDVILLDHNCNQTPVWLFEICQDMFGGCSTFQHFDLEYADSASGQHRP